MLAFKFLVSAAAYLCFDTARAAPVPSSLPWGVDVEAQGFSSIRLVYRSNNESTSVNLDFPAGLTFELDGRHQELALRKKYSGVLAPHKPIVLETFCMQLRRSVPHGFLRLAAAFYPNVSLASGGQHEIWGWGSQQPAARGARWAPQDYVATVRAEQLFIFARHLNSSFGQIRSPVDYYFFILDAAKGEGGGIGALELHIVALFAVFLTWGYVAPLFAQAALFSSEAPSQIATNALVQGIVAPTIVAADMLSSLPSQAKAAGLLACFAAALFVLGLERGVRLKLAALVACAAALLACKAGVLGTTERCAATAIGAIVAVALAVRLVGVAVRCIWTPIADFLHMYAVRVATLFALTTLAIHVLKEGGLRLEVAATIFFVALVTALSVAASASLSLSLAFSPVFTAEYVIPIIAFSAIPVLAGILAGVGTLFPPGTSIAIAEILGSKARSPPPPLLDYFMHNPSSFLAQETVSDMLGPGVTPTKVIGGVAVLTLGAFIAAWAMRMSLDCTIALGRCCCRCWICVADYCCCCCHCRCCCEQVEKYD